MDYKQNYAYSDWTVLIYAAGNNDLEYYIYQQFQLIMNSIDAENINVIVQISRVPWSGQQHNNAVDIAEEWNGTRRYIIRNRTAVLVDDLGEINMSRPNTLLDFLIWGASTFPSRNIMAILSGHGAGFVGIMKENTEKGATIMGIQGFAKALAIFRKSTNKKIDILVFDTCFMDTIEILYAIAINSNGAAVCAIISKNNLLVEGLPYYKIIDILKRDSQKNQNILHLDKVINLLITSVNISKNHRDIDLLAIHLFEDDFIILKKLIDSISEVFKRDSNKFTCMLTNLGFYLLNNDFIDLSSLLNKYVHYYPDSDNSHNELLEVLNKIIIAPSLNKKDFGLKLFFPHNSQVYLKYFDLYKKMSFCCDNKWVELIHETNL
ncbi:clostripain-related cysteine peptidase [Clostridium lacusfryxellense]|uniref:clostripain-related cysteine peptidase n=1 Tax=Clostridium lacusfryxellense TaxID=205328 RepID=UPI001C0CE6AF|nr:clostripain-related cysteine peptidase [Clostridium lacusfryxellense]MBU3114608.1 hypothetical protein [Clostridium lacusfryxellense]